MIKSDRWIRSKCQQPDGYVIAGEVNHEDKSNWVPVQRHKGEKLTDAAERVIFEVLKKKPIECTFMSGENLKEFIPMITPYEPGNIREVEKKLNYPPHTFTSMSIEPTKLPSGVEERGGEYFHKQKILSYGTSSFGYDVTLSDEFQIFSNINNTVIDPLNFDTKCLVPFKGEVCTLPPNSYLLGVTREYFRIPRDVMVICVGKSTYARCGAIVNVTPIEPGFEGHVVIEIANTTSLPMKIYADQGIAQFMFFQSDEECEVSYADKKGKYQGQTGVTLAKV